MKELIGSVFFIISLFGAGNFALKEAHRAVQRAALERAAKGLPSLKKMNSALRGKRIEETD
jgi:hypothetical protein